MRYIAAFAYLCTAVLSFVIAYRLRSRKQAVSSEVAYPLLYLFLGALLLAFAIERSTALVFEPVTQIFRARAYAEGWFATRRALQLPLLGAVAFNAVVLWLWLLYAVRRALARYILLAGAVAYFVLFAAVQLISYHYTDAILNAHVGILRGIHWLDLIGLSLAVAGMLAPLKSPEISRGAAK